VTDKDGSLDEEEQERLESKLRQRGWTYVGYTSSGISALRACIGQRGPERGSCRSRRQRHVVCSTRSKRSNVTSARAGVGMRT
jgi:hypothetical protein